MAYKQTTGSISLKEKKSNTFITGGITVTDRNISSDAFDRLRVSNPTTLFELNSIFGKNLHVEETVSGSAVSTFDSSNSYIQMSLFSSGTGKIIRQSYEYIPYQPGKSRLMMFTGVLELNGGINGSVSKIGCFDSDVDKTSVAGPGNGLFFELNGTTMYVVLRANDVDTKVSQSNWNYDKLDGNGPSGYTITNWGQAFLFAIDQEWLGIGLIRFGFFFNGQFKLVHIINNTSVGYPSSVSIIKPYNKTAKLPIRYEISSTSNVNSEMRMMCATVLSEGGFEPFGYLFSYANDTKISVGEIDEVVLSFRMIQSEPKNRVSVLLRSMDILNLTANKFVLYKIYIFNDENAVSGGTWFDVNTGNSVVQINETATSFNDVSGNVLKSGFVSLKENTTFPYQEYLNSPLLNSTIDGSSRILSLVCKGLGGNIDVHASFDWLEIQ